MTNVKYLVDRHETLTHNVDELRNSLINYNLFQYYVENDHRRISMENDLKAKSIEHEAARNKIINLKVNQKRLAFYFFYFKIKPV